MAHKNTCHRRQNQKKIKIIGRGLDLRKILSLLVVLCAILTLAACENKTKNNVVSSVVPKQTATSKTQSSVSKPEVTSSQVESSNQSSISNPTSAEKSQLIYTDKTVEVSGELENVRYLQKISELHDILNGYSYNVSLSVCSVDGSKGLYYNTNAEIFGACTVKSAYTLYACKQMEKGNGNLQTQITYEQKHYESGTGDMQYSPFGTVFSMETALYKSMSISDNVGYIMSVDYFGREGYNNWVSELGCESLIIKPTVWSLKTKSNDLVKIWREIYDYFQTDSDYAKFLYDSCTNTAGNYATAALDGVEYSHKQGHNSTGDWLSLSDAGIVWKENSPYIIAIITDSPGPSGYSADVFAKIINIVHNDLF